MFASVAGREKSQSCWLPMPVPFHTDVYQLSDRGTNCREINCKEVRIVMCKGLCENIFRGFVQCSVNLEQLHRLETAMRVGLEWTSFTLALFSNKRELNKKATMGYGLLWLGVGSKPKFLNAAVIFWCLFMSPSSLNSDNLAWIGKVQPGNWFV